MTLSRRDKFAQTAFGILLMKDIESAAVEATEYADALIAELDRTAPKPEPRPEVEDDGREIRCMSDEDELCRVGRVEPFPNLVLIKSNALVASSDARIFAHRILKLCDKIEGKK